MCGRYAITTAPEAIPAAISDSRTDPKLCSALERWAGTGAVGWKPAVPSGGVTA